MSKTNPDYSKSAVKLCNPPEVMGLLARWHAYQNTKTAILEEIENAMPKELKQALAACEDSICGVVNQLCAAITMYGSYQDVESGEYAVLQRRVKLEYNAYSFEARYPDLASAVLVKMVDVKTLEGLIKAGRLNEAELREERHFGDVTLAPVISEKEISPAYIIR